MGKFDGLLLVSDYDNTLVYTEDALQGGAVDRSPLPRDLAAIRRWMEGGGVFAVATGRSLAGYRRPARLVPTNAPAVVDNGASICDLSTGRRLAWAFLPPAARGHIAAAMAAFPTLCLELCHDDDLVQVMRPTAWNDQHARLTGAPYQVVEDLSPQSVPEPLSKAMFVAEPETLGQVLDFLRQRGCGEDCELIFSHQRLLEMTAKGANKGTMVKRLQAICGCRRLYCAGDHLNDLSMLQAADRAFCPANAVEEVRRSGATVVCHCREGAIGEIVELLEREIDG